MDGREEGGLTALFPAMWLSHDGVLNHCGGEGDFSFWRGDEVTWSCMC